MASVTTPEIEVALWEEVRIAMALNGGVSLAVWMGGCAVELDAARRAHLGPEPLGVEGERPPGPSALKSFLGAPAAAPTALVSERSRTIYHGICEAFGRELVIDLMSGASAGGINGALLGCATVNGRRLHPDFLRDKWLALGDLSLLLQRSGRPDPRSLMRGRMFHRELHKAFEELTTPTKDSTDPTVASDERTAIPAAQATHPHRLDAAKLVPQLDVTTTNLVGVERRYVDRWNGQLTAREYRARFAFREAGDYSADNLATAARSSASFPFAFRPWRVEGDAARLARLADGSFVIDGGLLDNAPVRAVLDLIPERPAERQVRRFVCYLNADPPLPEAIKGTDPTLFALAGSCLGLPRKAPFVDQLDAIERRARQSDLARDNQLGLLGLDDDALECTAAALQSTYRRRRMLLSLDEILDDPSDVRRAFERLVDVHELPWVPAGNSAGPVWGWGLRAAQRAIHLLLDAIRAGIEQARNGGDLARLRRLLASRATIDAHLATLLEERARLAADGAIKKQVLRVAQRGATDADVDDAVEKLKTYWCGYDQTAAGTVRAAATAAAGIDPTDLAITPSATQVERLLHHELFGDGATDQERVSTFVTRALWIEVIRRSFNDERDIDDAQPVSFVQLTPFTEIPIFYDPITGSAPRTPEDKLAGIRLGHFAAFYRRAWRANDFMWGRLDASARIVELLVDTDRSDQLRRQFDRYEPGRRLADCILSSAPTDDEVWLVGEVLRELDRPVPADPAELRTVLAALIEADLADGHGDEERGAWTVWLCTRAVQLEILGQELEVLNQSSQSDRLAGASSAPLGLALEHGLQSAIEELRPGCGKTLPERLDARGKMEIGSALGLRTATHVAFVALAALRYAKVPFATGLYVLRALLFPVAGAVSRIGWYRLVVGAGFSAAALYVASRIVTMDSPEALEASPATLGALVSRPVLVFCIALLAVLGVAALPLLRMIAGGSWLQRSVQLLLIVLLLAAGGGSAIALALGPGDLGPAQLLVTAGSDARLPRLLEFLILAIVFALPLFRQVPGVRGKIWEQLDDKRWTGPATAAGFLAVSIWLAVWAISEHLGGLLFDRGAESWKCLAAWTSVVGAPLVISVYLARSWIAKKGHIPRRDREAALHDEKAL